MLARITWLMFALSALVVAPGVFYLRFRRWPILSSFPPRNVYSLVNFLYGIAQAAYTALLLLGTEPKPFSTAGGLIVLAGGSTLALWAVLTMGPNWRMGQDEMDQSVCYVSHGPFRIFRHPIYVGLVIIAVGQGLLTGFDGRALLLIVASVTYALVQGHAESRYWARRQ